MEIEDIEYMERRWKEIDKAFRKLTVALYEMDKLVKKIKAIK